MIVDTDSARMLATVWLANIIQTQARPQHATWLEHVPDPDEVEKKTSFAWVVLRSTNAWQILHTFQVKHRGNVHLAINKGAFFFLLLFQSVSLSHNCLILHTHTDTNTHTSCAFCCYSSSHPFFALGISLAHLTYSASSFPLLYCLSTAVTLFQTFIRIVGVWLLFLLLFHPRSDRSSSEKMPCYWIWKVCATLRPCSLLCL